MQVTQEKKSAVNGNSLTPNAEEMRLNRLKVAAYDIQRQIQYLSQVQLPDLERQIAQLEQNHQERSAH